MPSCKKRKRKNNVKENKAERPAKQLKSGGEQETTATGRGVQHAVLSQYYAEVLTLRDYILLKLPASSRIRRKKIISTAAATSPQSQATDIELAVGTLLRKTLVGLAKEASPVPEERLRQWMSFSQKGGDESYVTLSDGLAGAEYSQPEIVDFVIWLLFSQMKSKDAWPKHLLCDGFRKRGPKPQDSRAIGTVKQGLSNAYPNARVEALKKEPWPQFLKLLGKAGDRIMMDLLLDSAVFVPVDAGQGNYYQLSGLPLHDAKPLLHQNILNSQKQEINRSTSEIVFVRSRMLYARAALNPRGLVHFGLRHIHVLNRAPYFQPISEHEPDEAMDRKNKVNTMRIMFYMFPRQFGLHNAFTSKVNPKETTHSLKDYTLRENEIKEKFGRLNTDSPMPQITIPKRLRGAARDLVQKLQILHSRCSYSKLLQHYCPISAVVSSEVPQSYQEKSRKSSRRSGLTSSALTQTRALSTKPNPGGSLMNLATPAAQVSAFCRSVVSNILPKDFLGDEATRGHNWDVLLKKVDQFIGLRRFEAMSLQEVTEGMKITDIKWLAPPQLLAHKTSRTDIEKRKELFKELMYYIFDSVLIPLIRSNFYVTESSVHKYRLLFFRHDVWRHIAEPAVAGLKTKMFEEVDLKSVRDMLKGRELGFSQVRLLPKADGMRPIMNLRRRAVALGNKQVLGESINNVLRPAHTVLTFEKSINPGKLGSTLFSVGDIYTRIKAFKSARGGSTKPLYFAKVDVRSAFDTIPQSAIVELLDSILQQREYDISRYVEIGNNGFAANTTGGTSAKTKKPSQRWHLTASNIGGSSTFAKVLAPNKRNVVIVENMYKKRVETSELLQLVASHIQQNLVKIGKKFYRQKAGIPQGSVLSSILCNYFYADLERHVLDFLALDTHENDGEHTLLLRLIDDFLLITTERPKAARFVKTMQAGVPEYGVTVNPNKSLVNFDLIINGELVSRVPPGGGFPYCGTWINTRTLGITKENPGKIRSSSSSSSSSDGKSRSDMSVKGKVVSKETKSKLSAVFNSLTVSRSHQPGHNFTRKLLAIFRMRAQLMFLDTSHNSAHTVLGNLFSAFLEAARRTHAYMRCLSHSLSKSASSNKINRKGFKPALITQSLTKLADVAYQLATSKARMVRYPGYRCDVTRDEVAVLAYGAFRQILRGKQTGFGEILGWLDQQLVGLKGCGRGKERGRVWQVLDSAS